MSHPEWDAVRHKDVMPCQRSQEHSAHTLPYCHIHVSVAAADDDDDDDDDDDVATVDDPADDVVALYVMH